METLIKFDMVTGLNGTLDFYYDCVFEKQNCESFSGTNGSNRPLDRIDSDVCGPITPVD